MKSISIFYVGWVMLVMLFGGTLSVAEEASSIMCDNGVVNIGDLDLGVQDKCGEPSIKAQNEWVYNFGPSQPVYTVVFKEGRVVRILEDESGS
jgi:hypothetical protein